MEKRVVTMILAFGRCRCLVVVTLEVSAGNNDCTDAADVGEGVLVLLLDVSSPPPPPLYPSRCDDDALCSGKKKAIKLLTRKLFEKPANPGTTSRLPEDNAYFPGFGGEHTNFLVRLTGWLPRGQPDPHQCKKFLFMCLFSSKMSWLL